MLRKLSAVLALAVVASLGVAAEGVLKKTETGSPKITNIDAIAFAPDGVLLIGDSNGAQVVAIDTKDTKAKPWKAGAIEKFNEKIADKLGTKADKLEFAGVAVNRASGTAYVLVKNGGKSTVVTVDGDGKIGELTTENIAHVAIPLPKSTTQITDLAYTKGRLLVGGLSKEAFKSKVYSIPTPLDSTKQATGFSTETYHVAHGKWETHAPMTTLVSLEQKGKQYVVGAFACTPIVRYSLDDVKQDAKVKGSSVIELGHGNRPQGMFTYEKDGKSYLLVNNRRHERFHAQTPIGPSQYWVARLDMSIFDETDKVNEKAPWRVKPRTATPVENPYVKTVDNFAGTRYMDRLDDKHAVVIKEDGKGGLTFAALELP